VTAGGPCRGSRPAVDGGAGVLATNVARSASASPPSAAARIDRVLDDWAHLLPMRMLEPLRAAALEADAGGGYICVDEYREGQDLVVRAELPGVDPEQDVTVEINDHRLRIEAERRESESSQERGFVRREMRYGHFVGDLALPEGVVESDVSARYTDGILEIRVHLPDPERRFGLAMANAPIGMALVGLDGRFIEVNQSLCHILGRSRDALVRTAANAGSAALPGRTRSLGGRLHERSESRATDPRSWSTTTVRVASAGAALGLAFVSGSADANVHTLVTLAGTDVGAAAACGSPSWVSAGGRWRAGRRGSGRDRRVRGRAVR